MIEVFLHPDGSAKRIVEFDEKGKQSSSTDFEPGAMENPVSVHDELIAFTSIGCLPVDMITK